MKKMSKPLVSITSAFYNTGPLLLDMVRSVFAQTYKNWELLLLDDGSTDNSLEIAKSIEYPRVKVFSNDTNKGRSYSLNRLTALSNGKYIARMDSDDMSSITRIEKQVQLIESKADIDVVGTGMCFLDGNDKPIGHWHARPSHEQICSQPYRSLNIAHGTILGKKSWFEKHHYDESLPYAIDFNLFLRSYEQSKFANVSEPLYYYRFDRSFNLKKQFFDRYISAKFLFTHYKSVGLLNKAIANFIIQYGKFVATMLIFCIGFRNKLMSRRFEALGDSDRIFYNKEIEIIKNTDIPAKSSI